jgi:hypothetical protein
MLSAGEARKELLNEDITAAMLQRSDIVSAIETRCSLRREHVD